MLRAAGCVLRAGGLYLHTVQWEAVASVAELELSVESRARGAERDGANQSNVETEYMQIGYLQIRLSDLQVSDIGFFTRKLKPLTIH